LLHGYFDESGTHAQSWEPVTFVAGFVGTTRAWRNVRKQWTGATGGKVFHYKDRPEQDLVAKLADILAASKLQVVAAGFCGDWNRAISHKPDWKKRFPSCYHAVFEMCVEQMDRWSASLWDNEPLSVMFSRQNEYADRALELWRAMQGNGYWPNLIDFGYGAPEVYPQLQSADMIAYETYQCLKVNTQEVWEQWPLVRLLIANGAPLRGSYHTPETFIEMMEHSERDGRQYLKTVKRS
jgi:hypothetical protein